MNAECGVRNAERGIPLSGALQRIMAGQYNVMIASEAGVSAGSVEAVHDLRVAIRRLRTLLRALRKPLAGTPAETLERRLQKLSRSLGPVRDSDIWVRFLEADPAVRLMAGWRALLAREQSLQRRRKASARRIMAGPAYHVLKADLEQFLRGLRARGPAGAQPLAPLAVKALRKALARVEDRSGVAPRFAPAAVHRLRIVCRRARYLAEFFGPALDRAVRVLGRRLRAVQDVLGDIHDCDVFAARLRRVRPPCSRASLSLQGPPAPRSVFDELEARRRQNTVRFRQAWKRLHLSRSVEKAV